MRTALVTGAGRGIGLATARLLGRRGMHVWLGIRSREKGAAIEAELRQEGIDARFVALDLTDAGTITAAAARIGANEAALDVLVNNAGIMNEVRNSDFSTVEPPSRAPIDRLRATFDTNFFGTVAVTQAMLPLLRRSSAGRIINVASRLGSLSRLSDQGWPPRSLNMLGYSGSKAALNLATLAFAIELEGTAIKINSVSPGTIATDLSGDVNLLAEAPDYGSPEDGAAVIVRYAELPEDGPTGRFFGPGGEEPW